MKTSSFLKNIFLFLLILTHVFIVTAQALGHGLTAQRPEVWSADARLFVVDNARSEIVVIDLPDGQVVSRITVPPKVMLFGGTESGDYVIAARGRDTDRQFVSVIASGVEKDGMRRPYIAKTLLLGGSVGGIHAAHLEELWGKLFLVSEQEAKLLRFDEKALASEAAFTAEKLPLGRPDHCDLMVMGDYVWAGYLLQGKVSLLDQQGKEVVTFACQRFHGSAFDEETGRAFFGCQDGILAVEDRKEKARIVYPISERIGSFIKGNDILVGTGERTENLQIVDPKKLTVTAVPLGSKLMAKVASKDGKFIYVLLQNGSFEVRDGSTGKLIRSIEASTPMPEMKEDVSGAILPMIALGGSLAYISLPQWGLIAEIDWTEGKLIRNLMIGGAPSRLVLIDAKGQAHNK